MSNEEVRVDEIEDTDDNIADIKESETTDWKAEAMKAQELARQQAGIAKRNATRLKKLREQAQQPEKKESKSSKDKSGFDYGELAYLTAKGISDEDHDFLLNEAKSTGKELKDILGFKYVQESLKARSDDRKAKEATPSSSRSGNAGRDSVDYWLAKVEAGTATVADIPDFQLRSDVVKARRKSAENRNHFTDNPVV